jgi:hypothetical protein
VVRLEHGHQLGPRRREQHDDERGAFLEPGVDLRAGVAELEVGRGHVRQTSVLEGEPPPRRVLNRPCRHAPEGRLDRVDGIRGREQARDVLFGQIQRHAGGV